MKLVQLKTATKSKVTWLAMAIGLASAAALGDVPPAPGRFANCNVVSYLASGGGSGTDRTAKARLGAGLASATADAETSSETWVVRSAADTNRTFAVRRARLASGGISMCAYSPNRVLATLAAGKSYATFVQEMTAKGLHVVRELMRDLDGNAVYVIEAKETENDIVEQMTMSIEETGSCTMVRPDSIYEANAVPNDTNYADQWGLEKIGAPEAWNSRTDASTVLVAVLDTGVNYDHIDLNQNLWVNSDETPGDGVDNDSNGIEDDVYGMASIGGNVSGNSMDDNGHGSHCAGIIGAAGNNRRLVSGVAWKAKVMALKFLDSEGNGFVSDAVTCLRYAEDHGVKIVNCSFGQSGTFDDYLYIQMKKMSQQGTIFACAAGNAKAGESTRDNDEFPFYPCNYSVDTIVSVAATDQNDALANFSYYGAQNVDIAAPGVDIYSTVLGSYGLGYKSGTSMATPHVTGALALLMAHYPGDTPAQIIDRLYAAAEPVPALAGKVRTGARLSMAGFFGISAPSEISVSQGTVNDAVVLYWTSVAEATHYRVWRSAEEGGEKTMLGDWRQALTYSDETAEPGVTYWYYLQAASSAEGAMASTFSEGVSGHRPVIDTSRITVAFNPAGGAVSPASKVYRIGETYSELPTPAYSGKAFLGWFTAASGGTRLDEPSIVRADAATLYAQWIDSDALRVENLFARQRYPWNGYVDVTFNLYGVPNDETASVSLTAQEEIGGSPIALSTFVGPAPTNLVNGAQHVVWNATPDTQGILYTNMILAATVAIDEKPLLPPKNVSASNATDSDAVVVTWSASENATSYEVWRATANNSSFASKVASPTTTSYRDTSAVPATTYWYWVKAVNAKKTSEFSASASGSRKKIATGISISGASSVTAGGTSTYTCTATYNDNSSASVTPTWSISSGSSYASINSSTGLLTANGTATPRSVTVQASYSYNGSTKTQTKTVTISTKSVTVSFNANGGSVSPTSQSYTSYGAYGSLPTPTRSQYSFLGWFTESSGGTQVTTSSTVPASATTLWAHWQQMTYTVTLDRQSGSGGSSSVLATYGSAMPSITLPTRTGYAFGGYYTSTGGGGTQYYTASGASARTWDRTAATTLYAKWDSFATALDNSSLTFTTGGDAGWGVTTAEAYSGGSSARSGAIEHSKSTWLQTVVSGAGVVSFWYKVSSESSCDKMTFYIDDVQKTSVSGEGNGWNQLEYSVTNNASHTFKWVYSKDGSQVRGEDCCWIDKVVWTRIVAPTGVTATQDRTDGIVISWTASAGATSYEIYRQIYNSASSSVKIGTSTSTSYTDTTALADQTYYYWVKAVGCSDFSSYAQGLRTKTLTSVEIDGPDSILSECGGIFTPYAYFSDGTKRNVGGSYGQITLSTNLYATISYYGWDAEPGMSYSYRSVLTAKNVTSMQTVTLTKMYAYNGVTQTVSKVVNILPAGQLTYTYQERLDGTVELTGYKGDTSVTSLVMPSSLNGCQVTRIYGNWLSKLPSLATITMPSSFTEIGRESFRGCLKIENVVVPSSVTNIAAAAFADCRALKSVVIPDSVKYIGCSDLFRGCTSLETVTLPDTATLDSFSYTFNGCLALKSVVLSSKTSYIDYFSFNGCTNLTHIYISDDNTSWKSVDGILFSKDGKTLKVFPAGRSGTYSIPSGVTKLAEYAFYRCSKLTSLTIPASIISINTSWPSIEECENLQAINVAENNEKFTSLNGVLYNKNCTTLIAYPSGKATAYYIMPDSMRWTSWTAWSTNLTNLVLSDSLYQFCFSPRCPVNCSTTIKFPNSLRSISANTTRPTWGSWLCLPSTITTTDPNMSSDMYPQYYFGDMPYMYSVSNARYYHFAEAQGWSEKASSYFVVWTNAVLSLEIDGENKVFAGCSVPLYAKGSFESGHFGIASKAKWSVVNGSSYASINPSNGVMTASANVTTTRNISIYAYTTLGGASAYANTYNVQIVPANTNTALIAIGKYAYNRLRWLPYPNAAKYNIRRGTSSTYANASIIDTYLNETLDGTETFVDDTAALGTTYYYWVEALDANGNTLNVTDYATAYRLTGDLTYVRDVLTKLNNGTYSEDSFVSDAEKGVIKELNYWKGVNSTWMSYIQNNNLSSITGANEMFWRSLYDLNTYIGIVMAMGGGPAITDITAASSTSATITWNTKLGVTSYYLYRGTSANSSSASHYASVSGTSYTDSSISTGMQYYYWVKAVTPTGTTDFGEGSTFMRVAVSFNANGGSVSPSSQTYTAYDTYGSLPTPTRTGYTFAGWWTASNGGTQVATDSTVSASATTFYAHWTANTYTVTLDRQSGSGGTASVTATYESAMPTITVPTRTGYTFGGYYTSTGGQGTQYYTAAGASVRNWDIITTTTLYAKWIAHTYTIRFDANGGTGTLLDMSMTYGVSKSLTSIKNGIGSYSIKRTGYTFAGWAKSKSGAVVYTDGTSVSNLSSTQNAVVVLYAIWTNGVTADGILISTPAGSLLRVGSSVTLTCNLYFCDGSTSKVSPTWSISSGSEYATISSSGVLRGTFCPSGAMPFVKVQATYAYNGKTLSSTKSIIVAPSL